MTNTSIEHLQHRIEEVVREYIAACRVAATTAVDRAFAPPVARRTSTSAARASARRAPGRRRGPDEMAGLSDRLYAAICANPGALMTVLSAHVGATPRELNRPALILKRAGRVRSVGQRQQTRYFPMAAKSA